MDKQKARNTAADMVRHALEQLTKWDRVQDLRRFDNTKDEAARLLDMAEAALLYFECHYDFPQAAPPRNCDVGTAEEQYARFKGFCNSHDCAACEFGSLTTGTKCCLAWAQMPYEEEGENDGSEVTK